MCATDKNSSIWTLKNLFYIFQMKILSGLKIHLLKI